MRITSISNSSPMNKIILMVISIFCFSIFGFAQAVERRPQAGPQDTPFGVLEFLHWNHSWNNYKYPKEADLQKAYQRMKEAGVGWVRVDFLWEDIEPGQGEFNFDKYDAMVDGLSANGIKILGILDYSAPWASSEGKWNYAPRESRLFVDYASAVIRRYKDRVKHWEVWNEPDSAIYWNPQDGLKGYCALLKDVYLAAKKIDPECKILNGGLAGGLASVNRLYDNGAKDYFDILNIHIFDNPLNPNGIKVVRAHANLARKKMIMNNDAYKKIWVTEIGCPGVKKGLRVKNWWMGDNPDERQQAAWVKEVYGVLLENPSVEKVFWAFFRDCQEHWKTGVDYFGLIRWDYSKKPAFKAYRKCYDNWKARQPR